MIFDELGLPKVSGASDKQDSAMFAGMLTVFEWPQKVDLGLYIVNRVVDLGSPLARYCRHPQEIKYNFSRDQYLCLAAGLAGQNPTYVNESWIDGNDLLSPSDHGHTRRCQGLKAYWYQDLYFWAELAFSAKFKPMDELNQLMAKMMVADKKFMVWYCNANPRWAESLQAYWCGWRNERDFCEHMIRVISIRISDPLELLFLKPAMKALENAVDTQIIEANLWEKNK